MKNILFFGVCLKIGFLRRGPSFVGMTSFWGGWFGMGDLFLTQGALLRRDDNFGWVLWNEVVGTYAEVASLLG